MAWREPTETGLATASTSVGCDGDGGPTQESHVKVIEQN